MLYNFFLWPLDGIYIEILIIIEQVASYLSYKKLRV